MTTRTFLRQKRTWLIGIPILLIAVFVGGPYVYIHFIEGDPPAKLAVAKVRTTKTATAASTHDGGRQDHRGHREPQHQWHEGPDRDVHRRPHQGHERSGKP